MATKIVTKNSSTASAVPTASDLVQGELAVNVADKRLFTEDNAGAIVELGTNPSALTVDGNVGIGTGSPATTLTVTGNGANGIELDRNLAAAAQSARLFFDSSSGGTAIVNYDGDTVFTTGAAAGSASGTERMRIDASGNVGIGTSSLTGGNTILNLSRTGSGAGCNMQFANSHSSAFYVGLAGNTSGDAILHSADGTAGMAFGTGNTERMRIDSAGNVGIGTTSPDTQLTLYKASTNADVNYAKMRMDSWGGSQGKLKSIVWDDAGSAVAGIGAEYDGGKTNIHFHSQYNGGFKGTADRTMSIMGNGNVGIGTGSPVSELDVAGTTPTLTIKDTQNKSWTSADTTLGELAFRTSDTSGIGAHNVAFVRAVNEVASGSTPSGALSFGVAASNANASEAMRIDSAGSTIIKSGNKLILNRTDNAIGGEMNYVAGTGFIFNDANGDGVSFNQGASNKVRIDTSGNLLVGKTTTGVAGAGIVMRGGGELFVTRAGDVMNLNRLTSDGPIAYFRKDGAVVGSIGSFVETYLFVGSSGNSNDTYLGFYNGTVRPVNASGTNRDNAIDLGTSSARFDDIYATNGTIQTSDRNEKQDIAELSDAEQRVAVACKGLLRKFRWKDSVAEKGDEARTHFGIIAQDLQDAFAAEGLDAGDYAMFISSTWTDEETNEEKTRMGVRYSELLAFIIAAL